MKRVVFSVLLLIFLATAAFAVTTDHGWPTLKAQLQKSHAPAGSALEKLIRENQDFSILRPDEAYDNLRIPLWLRVHWRKAHPEGNYSPAELRRWADRIASVTHGLTEIPASLTLSGRMRGRPIGRPLRAGS